MRRRTLIQLCAGVALSGVRPLGLQLPRRSRIVVAGAGIIGASVAYQLARRGAAVTVLERSRPGAGATANSFAWINAQKQPQTYFTLSHIAIEAWRELHRELGAELPVLWGGSLEWAASADAGERMAAAVRRYESWGYPVHRIEAARLRELEASLVPGNVACAAHGEIGGKAEPG